MRATCILSVLALVALTSIGFSAEPPSKPGGILTAEEVENRREAGNLHKVIVPDDPFGPNIFTVGFIALARAQHLDSFEQIGDEHQAGGGIEFGYSFSRNVSLRFATHGLAAEISDNFINEGDLTLAVGVPFGNFNPYGLVRGGWQVTDRDLDLNVSFGAGAGFAVTRKLVAFVEGARFQYLDGRSPLSGREGYEVRFGLRWGFPHR
jgi:hypothetical protein